MLHKYIMYVLPPLKLFSTTCCIVILNNLRLKQSTYSVSVMCDTYRPTVCVLPNLHWKEATEVHLKWHLDVFLLKSAQR